MNRLLMGILLGIVVGSVVTSIGFGPSIELVKEARSVINHCEEFNSRSCQLSAVVLKEGG